jgi:hypothetical protein
MPSFKKGIIQENPEAKCKFYRGLWTIFLNPWSMPFTRAKCPLIAWRMASKRNKR